jgi:hypothetical protein
MKYVKFYNTKITWKEKLYKYSVPIVELITHKKIREGYITPIWAKGKVPRVEYIFYSKGVVAYLMAIKAIGFCDYTNRYVKND